MTPKKKINVVTKPIAGTDRVKTPPATNKPAVANGKTDSVGARAPAGGLKEQPRPADLQLSTWDKAVRLFSQRRFEEAAPLFREAAGGPACHVADKARSYEQICIRQCARPEV